MRGLIAAATLALLLVGLSAAPARAEVGPETFAYGPHAEQTIDVTTIDTDRVPDGTDGFPWVMVVHGGSWAAGGKGNAARAADAFSAAGFVVFNVEYRKITDYAGNPGVPWAEQRDDVVAALDWARGHALQFGADPARGAIYGFSAGGHLAASAGLYGDGHRVRAIVSASGVLQPHRIVSVINSDPAIGHAGDKPTELHRTVYGWQSAAMRCPSVPWTDCASRWLDFRPESHISPGDPPIFMTQGTADPGVPPYTVKAFKYWMNRAGIEAELVECAGWGHTETCALDGGWREDNLMAWVKEKTA